MKVFEIKFTKLEKSEFEKEDEIIEVPEKDWNKIIIIDKFAEYDVMTVEEFMRACDRPCVICVDE